MIVQIHLGDRDVELTVQARHQRLEAPALFLERGAGGEVEMNGKGSKHYF